MGRAFNERHSVERTQKTLLLQVNISCGIYLVMESNGMVVYVAMLTAVHKATMLIKNH